MLRVNCFTIIGKLWIWDFYRHYFSMYANVEKEFIFFFTDFMIFISDRFVSESFSFLFSFVRKHNGTEKVLINKVYFIYFCYLQLEILIIHSFYFQAYPSNSKYKSPLKLMIMQNIFNYKSIELN